jgi:predicted lysophospholipase L1 biosynthesis ABC-type transport system permease subunit
MEPLVLTYAAYVLITVPLTLWVGHTLRRNGRVFLLDVFEGDEDLATAVNHLLVVGFYLVNLGYVCLALKVGDAVLSTTQAIEALSVKVGAVVLVLGVLHLGNLWVLNRLRRRAQLSSSALRPPVAPDGYWTTNGAIQAPA